jgi:hypothetical protein
MIERFVIDTYGVDQQAELEAMRWLVREAAERGSEAAIVVPAVDSIESLGRVIGGDVAAHAKRHRVFTLNGITVHVFTLKTQHGQFHGPVLVAWADTAMVESAERLHPPAICALGWSEDGLDGWKRAWGPIDPRTGERDILADETPPLVRAVVTDLSGSLGNDVLHPTDKRRAVNAFKALYMLGVPIDSTLVRSLAIQHGWEPKAADRLQAIARKISEGRAVKGGDPMTQTKAKALVARLESQE